MRQQQMGERARRGTGGTERQQIGHARGSTTYGRLPHHFRVKVVHEARGSVSGHGRAEAERGRDTVERHGLRARPRDQAPLAHRAGHPGQRRVFSDVTQIRGHA